MKVGSLPRRRLTLREMGLAAGVLLTAVVLIRVYHALVPSYAHVSRATLSSDQADRQIEAAKSYLQFHPEDFNAYAQLAVALYYKGPGAYVDAMNALEKARSLGATDEVLFYYAGVMDEALGLPDYAINELSKYLRHHPGDYETTVRLANIYFQEKRYDEALSYYDKVMHHWPKDPTVLFNYAVVNKEKGQLDQAIALLDQVQKVTGGLPEGGFFEKGEIWRLKGSPDTAVNFYQQELARNPAYLPALEALESIQKQKGDYKEARALHKRILEIKQAKNNPANPA